MQIASIPDILTWPNGTPIEAVQGKLTAAYERRSVNTKFGQKTVQNADLQDAGGNKIKLSVWDMEDISNKVGNEWILHSIKGKGLVVRHESYVKDGETKNVISINVSKAGRFQPVEVHGNKTTPHLNVPNVQGIQIDADTASGISVNVDNQTATSKKRLNKLANIWLACYDAARYCREVVTNAGEQMAADQFQACVSSLFIQSTRDNIQFPGGTYGMENLCHSLQVSPLNPTDGQGKATNTTSLANPVAPTPPPAETLDEDVPF